MDARILSESPAVSSNEIARPGNRNPSRVKSKETRSSRADMITGSIVRDWSLKALMLTITLIATLALTLYIEVFLFQDLFLRVVF